MTPHSPAFADALAAVTSALGDPSSCEHFAHADYSLATWRREGSLLDLDDYGGEVQLRGERTGAPDDFGRVLDAEHPVEESLRLCVEWLGWTVPS